jgi:hypothetical protein
MALSMNLRSILHIRGHERPEFSKKKKKGILLSVSSEKCPEIFSPVSWTMVTTFDEFHYFPQISVILGALLSTNVYYVPCAIGDRINDYL